MSETTALVLTFLILALIALFALFALIREHGWPWKDD